MERSADKRGAEISLATWIGVWSGKEWTLAEHLGEESGADLRLAEQLGACGAVRSVEWRGAQSGEKN